MAAKYPEIHVTLDAPGDDFRVIDRVMRRAGIPAEDIDKFCDEAMSGKDRELLQLCERWVTVARH
jgi:hypothetical protein